MEHDQQNRPSLTEDYATQPVPLHATYNGWRIGFVLGGIGVALPGLLSGAEIGRALGYVGSMQAFFVASVLVSVLAIMTGLVGMQSRLSTYMILKFSFGPTGAKLVNASFAFAQFGWFGVNAWYFGEAAAATGSQVLGIDLPISFYIVLGSILMTLATIFGFKALDKIAIFVFPVMITTLALMVARTFELAPLSDLIAARAEGGMSFSQAVTALAGGIIVGVLLVPDLTRYARTRLDVGIAIFIALVVIEPLVRLAASGAAISLQNNEPLAILLALRFGAYAFVFLIFTAVTTNAINLYGSGLAMASIFARTKEWKFIIVAGIVGMFIALSGVQNHFIDFLIWQSILFSSVLGVYVVDFYLVRKGKYSLDQLDDMSPWSWRAFLAWGLGAAIAAVTSKTTLVLTGMPNLDGVLVAGICYALVMGSFGRARGGNHADRH